MSVFTSQWPLLRLERLAYFCAAFFYHTSHIINLYLTSPIAIIFINLMEIIYICASVLIMYCVCIKNLTNLNGLGKYNFKLNKYFMHTMPCLTKSLLLLFCSIIIHASLYSQGTLPVLGNPSEFIFQNVRALGSFDDRLVFDQTVSNRRKVWVSDGTAEGTFQIGAENQTEARLLFRTDAGWYFQERIGSTYFLAALFPGSDTLQQIYQFPKPVLKSAYWNGDFYYSASSSINFSGEDLVKLSLSTLEGTILYTSGFGGIRLGIAATDDYLIFQSGTSNGKVLVRSDGTVGGTIIYYQLYDIQDEFATGTFIVSDGEKVYFSYHPNNEPNNLWVTDGTEEGTHLLTVLGTSPFGRPERGITFLDGRLFLLARRAGAASGDTHDLFISDGSVEGTYNYFTSALGDTYLRGRLLRAFNGKVYYHRPFGFFATDGTISGTELIVSGDFDFQGVRLAYDNGIYNDSLIIAARGPGIERGIYISDGTAEGISLLTSLPSESGSGTLGNFQQVGERLFFFQNSSSSNFSNLWVYDPNYTEPISCAGFSVDTVVTTNVLDDVLGSISVSASGGLPPYTYRLNDDEPSNDSLFLNLSAATYRILITDSVGCTVEQEVTIEFTSATWDAVSVGSFQLYPNPVKNDILTVSLRSVKTIDLVDIEVFDWVGRRVGIEKRVPLLSQELDYQLRTNQLPNGNYILHITASGARLASGKFSILRNK